MDRPLGLIGAPTSAAAHSPGQEKAPEAFRVAGIVTRLADAGVEVDDRGDLPMAHFAIDTQHRRAQNVPRVVAYVGQVADAVAPVLDAGEVPLVLGGDCTVLLGVLTAYARREEQAGVFYLDAHADLNTPTGVVQGALDWMGMAHALDLPEAVPELAAVGPRRPLVDPGNVLFFAYIPSEQTGGERDAIARLALEAWPVERVSGRAGEAAAEAAAWLARRVARFVVHLDVDVIDFVDFPVADNAYQRNQGLTLDEAMQSVRSAAAHPAFGGLVVSQFNPDHAAGQGPLAEQFVKRLARALAAGQGA